MARQLVSEVSVGVVGLLVLLSCGVETGREDGSHDKTSSLSAGQVQSSDLHIAAVNGDIESISRLISEGTDVNARRLDGVTPLHWAAWAGQKIPFRRTELPPQSGVRSDVEQFRDHGLVAELLIKGGADVNAKDAANSTPLHAAAFHGNLAVARVLLDNGADANARRDDGATPLILSIASGHVSMTDLLKRYGAQMKLSGGGTSARRGIPADLQIASQWPSADVVRTDVESCEKAYNTDLCNKAVSHFDRMLESGQGTDRQRASAFAARARILSNSYGQHVKAISDYAKAIDLNPSSSEFHFNRGNTYLRLNENELALADYNEAIRLDPSNLDVYGSRGWAHHLMGRNDLALRDFGHILERRPNELRALLNRATVYKDLGRTTEAVNDLRNAYRNQPGNEQVISHLKELGEKALPLRAEVLAAAEAVRTDRNLRKALLLDRFPPDGYPATLKRGFGLSNDELAAICMFAGKLHAAEWDKVIKEYGTGVFVQPSQDYWKALSVANPDETGRILEEIEAAIGPDESPE